jgi:hypothetical protein
MSVGEEGINGLSFELSRSTGIVPIALAGAIFHEARRRGVIFFNV